MTTHSFETKLVHPQFRIWFGGWFADAINGMAKNRRFIIKSINAQSLKDFGKFLSPNKKK